MHYAAAWKHKNCMDLLLEAGGSLLQVNDSGQAPLEMASDSFAALFQLQKTAQLKLQAQKKGIKVPNKLDLKSMFKKKQKANNANKSTHLDSSESGKSIFTSVNFLKPRKVSAFKTSKFILCWELVVLGMFIWSKRKTQRNSTP